MSLRPFVIVVTMLDTDSSDHFLREYIPYRQKKIYRRMIFLLFYQLVVYNKFRYLCPKIVR